MKKRLILAGQALALLVLIMASAYMFISKTIQARERNELEKLADTYATYVITNDLTASVSGNSTQDSDDNSQSGSDLPANIKASIDFDALQEINSDISGWVYIDGTPVNYPFVQTTDNSYYLGRSFSHERSRLGTIFLDCDLSITQSDILILYGHSFGNESSEMFSPLSSYDDADFLHSHREILLHTIDGETITWHVFAVLHISIAQQDVLELYRKQNFHNEAQFDAYIELIKSKQLFDTGITPVSKQRILMLSTCVGNLFGARRSDMRRLVFAYEISNP